jgi:hypothetical protein
LTRSSYGWGFSREFSTVAQGEISIQEMGKRKLAGSVRRYVATGLSRVTKGIAGAFHSSEERQSPAANGSNQIRSSHVNGSLPVPSVAALPVTKVPALDTVDRYAANEPIVDAGNPVGRSPRVKLSCTSDVRNVIDSLLGGYARFISSLTGLEDIAFLTNRTIPFVESKASRSIVVASVSHTEGQSKINTIEVDSNYHHSHDEVQFYAELGISLESSNGKHKAVQGQDTVSGPKSFFWSILTFI